MHAMIINFCKLEDGSFSTEIDLHQYGIDSEVSITNTIVQELCIIQPEIKSLDLTDCNEISDASLWSIAMNVPAIQRLILSKCHKITNIGLRSISLRCSNMKVLDFSFCYLLDDIAMTVLATGCWSLETVILRGCTGVTDTGVGKLVKASDKIKMLDLKGCRNVGEFGDHACREIGAFCCLLEDLDMTDCRRVEDTGIRALAVGCQRLRRLLLPGCDSVSVASLRAVSALPQLTTLALTRCGGLRDRDFEALQSSPAAAALTDLDLTDCAGLTDKGVAVICKALSSGLKHLCLKRCSHITDFSSAVLANLCSNLRQLDLTDCRRLTDESVHTIARRVTGLTSLRLDGAPLISTAALASHLIPCPPAARRPLPFVDLARSWLGYQPKPAAAVLIRESEDLRFREQMAIVIQKNLRRKFALSRCRELRRWWIIAHRIPLVQAVFRGFVQLKRYRLLRREAGRLRKCVQLQSFYRTRCAVRRAKRLKQEKQLKVQQTLSAVCLQRVLRGRWGRVKASDQRNAVATRRLLLAKRRVQEEVSAVLLQSLLRGWLARRYASRIQQAKALLLSNVAKEEEAARLIQRHGRGMLGRVEQRRRKQQLVQGRHRWIAARELQRVYRGLRGRRLAKVLWELRQREIRDRAVRLVQRAYRGHRGRLVAAVAKALKALRQMQSAAVCDIQRIGRGHIARRIVSLRKDQIRVFNMQSRAAKTIQRLYRGHKGREARYVEAELRRMEAEAKPLFERLQQQEEQQRVLLESAHRKESFNRLAEEDLQSVEKELYDCMHSTMKYTDSARINPGVSQRYLTKYLRVRLADHFLHKSEEMAALKREEQDLLEQCKHVKMALKATRRELVPLTTGFVHNMRQKRSAMVRQQVRTRNAAATKLQSLWRRALVRTALSLPDREYWVVCFDDAQSEDPFYFNTWTQQTSWQKPQPLRYFPLQNP